MKNTKTENRQVLAFNSFLLMRESENQKPCSQVWIVETPDADDARLFRSYDEAEREHEMQMQSHREVWADVFASRNASETEDEYPEASWQDRYNMFYDKFMERENANNWGQPPYIDGPFNPSSNGSDVATLLKRAVQNDHKQVASELMACGADPLHAFKSAEEILSFFDGDLSLLPLQAIPEGPIKDKIRRIQQEEDLFGSDF